jgi:NADH:ubiquinone reductase (non-electrogenic)
MINVVVVGSGWAGSGFLKNIDTNKYNVSVISPTPFFVYTPNIITSIFYNCLTSYNIKNINPKIKYIEDKVEDVDFNNNNVILKNSITKNILKFDYLVLAHGSEINTFNIKGVKENCKFIKTNDDVNNLKKSIKNLPNNANVAVIGCSATGSELIGSLIDNTDFNLFAIDGLQKPLQNYKPNVSDLVLETWKNNNVSLYFNNFVRKIDSNNIYFNNNKIKYDIAIWCGGIKKNILSEQINNNLGLDCKFGIPVNKFLRVEKCHNVYAMGDCAFSDYAPTAQVAYQQGKYLAERFNSDFKTSDFNYIHRGKTCYIGKGIGVFENEYFSGGGKIIGYLNKFINFYNSLDFRK